MHPKAWYSYCSDQEGNGADDVFHPSSVWRGSPSMAHRVLEAGLPLRTWLGHDPRENIAVYSSHRFSWRKRSACPWIHPNLLDTAGHSLPEEWETSRLWPRQITALDFTSILFLRICHYCAESCCVTWSGPEYLCTSPWQSQRQTEILRSWVQSQHSPTSAACSSTRLFCASLRVSKHLYQQACERQK